MQQPNIPQTSQPFWWNKNTTYEDHKHLVFLFEVAQWLNFKNNNNNNIKNERFFIFHVYNITVHIVSILAFGFCDDGI